MALPRSIRAPDRQSSIDALAERLGRHEPGSIERELHTARDPWTGRPLELVDLLAHFRPYATRRFVLATHYDTRPWADEDPVEHLRDRPVPGANDGTSGLALLYELIPLLLRDLPPDIGFTVILFDGEELGRGLDDDAYCVGSRHLATRIRDGVHPLLGRAEFGIVVDMVGDARLRIPVEPRSSQAHPRLVAHVWDVAAALGASGFVRTAHPRAILDDHVPLTSAGIPSILILDPDYDAWHTTRDTLERISAESLEQVGRTLHHALVTWFAPKARSAAAP